MTQDRHNILQSLPKVDRILEDHRIISLTALYPRSLVVDTIREYLNELREQINTSTLSEVPDVNTIIDEILRRSELTLIPGLRRCINGAGIILHTALGRAPIAPSAREALLEVVQGYCTLQIDLDTGKRGDRYTHVQELLKKLTGAEAALVVNNNAAATLLILHTLAEGKEVILSRGELVEIGGAFRIPDVMRRSGAKLVEVGTTNRTHPKDYVNAITEATGLILKVHQSNYKIIGFTSQVSISELAELAHAHNLPMVDDIGSGALVDLSRWGLPREPLVRDSITAGADLVCFSGDKLLGGPQCGIIIGKRQYINKIKANHLTRALRCDKMTFTVLEATLRLFLDEEKLPAEHPVLRMLTMSQDEIRKRCRRLKRLLDREIQDRGVVSIEPDSSEAGSGSLAATSLPTWVTVIAIKNTSAEELAKKLRCARIPVFGRIKDDKFLLDCRTINDDELSHITRAFSKIVHS
jgi:L-seryl-tRNA(Ser) seleniumtransferase